MPFTHAVIMESLRMTFQLGIPHFTSATANVAAAAGSKGFSLPRGTTVRSEVEETNFSFGGLGHPKYHRLLTQLM